MKWLGIVVITYRWAAAQQDRHSMHLFWFTTPTTYDCIRKTTWQFTAIQWGRQTRGRRFLSCVVGVRRSPLSNSNAKSPVLITKDISSMASDKNSHLSDQGPPTTQSPNFPDHFVKSFAIQISLVKGCHKTRAFNILSASSQINRWPQPAPRVPHMALPI